MRYRQIAICLSHQSVLKYNEYSGTIGHVVANSTPTGINLCVLLLIVPGRV